MKPSTRILLMQKRLLTPIFLGSRLALWLDAADSRTIILDGSTVSQWRDKSGNSRHASQPNKINQPTYSPGGLGNKPVVTFDGINNIMLIGGQAFAPGARSAIAVARFNNGERGLAQLKTSENKFFDLIVNVYGAVSFIGDLGATGVSVGFGGALFTTNPVMLHYQYNGGTNTLPANYAATLDGTPQTIVSRGNYNGISTNQSGLGGRYQSNGTPQFPMAGYIAEYIVVDGAISMFESQQLTGYLAWKRGLTANLPNNHPFKFRPPYM